MQHFDPRLPRQLLVKRPVEQHCDPCRIEIFRRPIPGRPYRPETSWLSLQAWRFAGAHRDVARDRAAAGRCAIECQRRAPGPSRRRCHFREPVRGRPALPERLIWPRCCRRGRSAKALPGAAFPRRPGPARVRPSTVRAGKARPRSGPLLRSCPGQFLPVHFRQGKAMRKRRSRSATMPSRQPAIGALEAK